MSARRLTLEVVTPEGIALEERELDAVVLRRLERRFDPGSEIGIFPLHSPALIRMPIAPLRFRRGASTGYAAVFGGFAEVKRDRVRVVTPRCRRIPPGDPDPARRAAEVCAAWRRESDVPPPATPGSR